MTTTGTGIITRSRTNTFTSTGVYTFSSTGVITGLITSTDVFTITNTGVRTGSGTSVGCAYAVPPTASGTLSVTSGYVTTGTLRGYGFTWKSDQSNATTCIVPTCNTTGCSPAFGSSALCASGYVTADTTYNSAVGVGFNLNQDSSGTTNLTVPAPASVTVTTSLFGGAMGNPAMRVQITDAAGTSWCVEAGQWASGTPIPISSFNTACWDSMTGKTLTAGQPIQSINLVIPADAVMDRPFAFCLTGVSL